MGKKDHVWRVTKVADGGIDINFGTALSESGFSDTAKVKMLGRALMSLGAQLADSRAVDADDEDEDY